MKQPVTENRKVGKIIAAQLGKSSMLPNGPNHVWAVDFVHDKSRNNRSYKMLTVVDEYIPRHLLFM